MVEFHRHADQHRRDALRKDARHLGPDAQELDVLDRPQAGEQPFEPLVDHGERVAARDEHVADRGRPPDVVDHLVVVVVRVPAPHRLGVAAVLLGELVDKRNGALGVAPAAGDPLVPAGDENELRVDLQRAPPLLLEIEAQVDCTRPSVLAAIMPTTPHGSHPRAHRGRTGSVGQRVLGNANAHLLSFAGAILEDVLRIDFEPAPHIWLGRPAKCKRGRRARSTRRNP